MGEQALHSIVTIATLISPIISCIISNCNSSYNKSFRKGNDIMSKLNERFKKEKIMQNLMEWHFSVQEGMYFDKRNETRLHIVFSSKIMTDGSCNYVILKSGISLKDEIEIIECTFNDMQRSPCIYLSNDENYDQWSQFLEQRGYSMLSEESVMLFD